MESRRSTRQRSGNSHLQRMQTLKMSEAALEVPLASSAYQSLYLKNKQERNSNVFLSQRGSVRDRRSTRQSKVAGQTTAAGGAEVRTKKVNLEFKVTPYRLVNMTPKQLVIRRRNVAGAETSSTSRSQRSRQATQKSMQSGRGN